MNHSSARRGTTAAVASLALALAAIAAPLLPAGAAQAAPGTACAPVDVFVNTAGASPVLNSYSLAGQLRSSVPLPKVYGDIAFSSDGTVLYGISYGGTPSLDTITVATGALLGSVPLTGPAASVADLNALSALPSGALLAGAAGSSTLYSIDPVSGSSLVSAQALPSGVTSGGDFLTLDDGDVLALGAISGGSALVRLHPGGTAPDVVGHLPSSFGLAQVAGSVVVAQTDGTLAVLGGSPPTAASTSPLPLATVAATGLLFYGATSVQDSGACNTMTTTSRTATYPAGSQPELVVSGLAPTARGTVTFTAGATALCSVVLPATSCLAPVLPPGTYTAVATLSSNGQTTSTTFTVLPPGSPSLLPQTVTLTAPASAPLAGRTVRVQATASGGGAITYTTSDPSVATVDADGMLTLRRVGTVTVLATAAATATHHAGSAAATITVLPPPTAELPEGASRLGGLDRVETAIAVAHAVFPDPSPGSATDVVIATTNDPADSIAGARLAGQLQGPLLLNGPDHLDADVAAEVRRLARTSGRVYLLGQQEALSDAVEQELRTASSGYSVQRVGGADRYATAVDVAVAIGDRAGNSAPIYVVTGRDPSDGLVVVPYAQRTGGVVVLTDDAALPAVTARYLRGQDPTGARTVAVGGTAAAAVARAGGASATAVVGADRYATAATLARRFAQLPDATGAVTPVDVVGVAGGGAWPDSLAGAAAMSHLGGPLLLTATGSTQLPAPTREAVAELGRDADRAVVFGGAGPVGDAVLMQLGALLRG